MKLRPLGLTNYSVCAEDRLEVYDWNHQYIRLDNRCGDSTQGTVQSYTNTVLIVLSTVGGSQGNLGATIVVRRSCGQYSFTCPSDPSNRCLKGERICDGHKDCPGGEDEICTNNCGLPFYPSSAVSLPQTRIIGGAEADANSWPWQVYIKFREQLGSLKYNACGGSIIGPQWVVTAAHCCARSTTNNITTLYPTEQVEVIVGAHNSKVFTDDQKKKVNFLIISPFYHPKVMPKYLSDFCILKLAQRLTFTSTVSAVCLPRGPPPPSNTICMVTGWGQIKPRLSNQTGEGKGTDVLLQVDLQLISNNECGTKVPGLAPEMVCAQGANNKTDKDACSGDSGGPLVCRLPKSSPIQWELIGLTSYGIGCGIGYPGVYTSMRHMMATLIRTLYAMRFDGWFSEADTMIKPLDTGNLSTGDYQIQVDDQKVPVHQSLLERSANSQQKLVVGFTLFTNMHVFFLMYRLL
ncbi:chymotrypsinogen 2-like isoform X2 [Paramacrobiotus metropolitanus]|nr:chymotrypsinogen 2-like isoform X2 [Paramacrobiotus metropolitanus]